uniref:Cholesterol 25-hydroxylase n=1 Tax=Scleropages formosus TaxID=113540 RepID=A0A8C9RAB4_SCLFO
MLHILFSLAFYLSFCLYFVVLGILSLFIFPVTLLHWYLRLAIYPAEAPACLLLFDFQDFVWHLVHYMSPGYTTLSTGSTTSTHPCLPSPRKMLEPGRLCAWGFFAAVNPMLLCCHPLTEILFYVLNILLLMKDHSGYDFPWSTQRLAPFGLYGGAVHYSIHHQKFTYNYAPCFTLWDKLFGTLYSYRRPAQLRSKPPAAKTPPKKSAA